MRFIGNWLIGFWQCPNGHIKEMFPRLLEQDQDGFKWVAQTEGFTKEVEVPCCPDCHEPLIYDEAE